jgi:protein TonB
MGVEGKVFVQFVIGKDGSISDVKVIKGIGAGCDEEAIRIVQSSPAWNPGKQRGKPVKQRYTLPIQFKLG